MPSRALSLLIVSFWLATTGWLFHRDLWPHLRPPETYDLPDVIDLADEGQAARVSWKITDGKGKVGWVRSQVTHRPEDDTYEVRADYHFTRLKVLGIFSVH